MFDKKLTLVDQNNKEIKLIHQSFDLGNLSNYQWYYDDNSKTLFPNENNVWDQLDKASSGMVIRDRNGMQLYKVLTFSRVDIPS